MNILSIDIGIKHLAHCLLQVEHDKITILDWEVINLTNEEPLLCGVCGKKATYRCNEGCFCKIHTRKLPYFIASKEYPLEKISKKTLPELITILNYYQTTKPWVKVKCDQSTKTSMLRDLKIIKDTQLFTLSLIHI